MIFHVSVTEIYVLFFGLENVDRNLRQKDSRHFTAELLVLEQIYIKIQICSLLRSIIWCNNLSNISNSFGDTQKESNAFGKKKLM